MDNLAWFSFFWATLSASVGCAAVRYAWNVDFTRLIALWLLTVFGATAICASALFRFYEFPYGLAVGCMLVAMPALVYRRTFAHGEVDVGNAQAMRIAYSALHLCSATVLAMNTDKVASGVSEYGGLQYEELVGYVLISVVLLAAGGVLIGVRSRLPAAS